MGPATAGLFFPRMNTDVHGWGRPCRQVVSCQLLVVSRCASDWDAGSCGGDTHGSGAVFPHELHELTRIKGAGCEVAGARCSAAVWSLAKATLTALERVPM